MSSLGRSSRRKLPVTPPRRRSGTTGRKHRILPARPNSRASLYDECPICFEPLGPTDQLIQFHPDPECYKGGCHVIHLTDYAALNPKKCYMDYETSFKELPLGSFVPLDGTLQVPNSGGRSKKTRRTKLRRTKTHRKMKRKYI